MTKLRKHAAALALAGMLALFGTACASDDGGESETEAEAGASEPAATSEAAS